jgi:flagellar protein FliS
MMAANPFAAYLESKVLAASPLQLIHLAYEGTMDAITEARRHLAEKNIHGRVQAITKAQQIITELQAALNFEQGGELSTRLASLYEYAQRRLNEANFQQVDEPLAEVHRLLETVDGAWKEIAAAETPQPQSSPWMTPDAPIYRASAYTL